MMQVHIAYCAENDQVVAVKRMNLEAMQCDLVRLRRQRWVREEVENRAARRPLTNMFAYLWPLPILLQEAVIYEAQTMRKYNNPNVLPIFTSFVDAQVRASFWEAVCVTAYPQQLHVSRPDNNHGCSLFASAGAVDSYALLPRRISPAYYEVWPPRGEGNGAAGSDVLCDGCECATQPQPARSAAQHPVERDVNGEAVACVRRVWTRSSLPALDGRC